MKLRKQFGNMSAITDTVLKDVYTHVSANACIGYIYTHIIYHNYIGVIHVVTYKIKLHFDSMALFFFLGKSVTLFFCVY